MEISGQDENAISVNNWSLVDPERPIPELEEPTPIDYKENLYDFGPFEEYIGKITEAYSNLEGVTDNPLISNTFLMESKRMLHESVLINPTCRENTKIGMQARLEALQMFDAKIKHRYEEFAKNFPDMQDSVNTLRATTDGITRAEQTKIQMILGQPPISFVDAALTHLLTKKERQALSGKLRIQRDKEIHNSLKNLEEYSLVMKRNVGNRSWEEAEGIAYSKKVKDELKKTEKLMKHVEHQATEKGFHERFNGIQTDLNEVSGLAVTDRLKESMKEIIDSMKKFFDKVLDKMGLKNASPPTLDEQIRSANASNSGTSGYNRPSPSSSI